jgi:AcrR family transcriptional regulator
MARRRPDPPSSRARLLTAARQEFAARGFDGAKVDRIAARARVNKAMLYYHFRNKAALYRAILHELFHGVAEAVTAVRAAGGTPDEQLRRFVEAVARRGIEQPDFPGVWLREMADGGRHLDAVIVAEFQRVLGVLAAILADGRRQGAFRDTNPFVTHLGIVAPLLFFAATAPMRRRFAGLGLAGLDPAPDLFIAHVQHTTLAALAPAGAGAGARPADSRTRR